MAQAALKMPIEQAKTSKYELLSLLGMAMKHGVDRQTVKKRLDEAGLEPFSVKTKEKLYEQTPLLLSVVTQPGGKLDEVKLKTATAQMKLVEMKVDQAAGGLVPLGEMIDVTQRLFGAMHKEIAVRQPQRLGSKLARAKTAAAAAKIVKADTERIFKTLRDDWVSLLK